MQLFKLSAFMWALFLCICAQAQNPYRISDLAKQRIDSMYTKHAKAMKKGGVAIAIIDTAGLVYAQGYGFADFENKIPATDSTIFGIGSMTKSFTALALLQLESKGLLSTSASVKKYLPELTIANSDGSPNALTIDQLLAHTSGMQGDVFNGFFCDAPPAQSWAIAELNKQFCAAPANHQFAYSNVGYGLLGETIQRVSGMSYANYLNEHVWSPLQMHSTFIDRNDARHAKAANTYIDGKMYRDPFIRDEAAGMIRSNVLDMAKYMQALLLAARGNGNETISTAAIRAMSTDRHTQLKLKTVSYEHWGWGLYFNTLKCKTDSTEATWIGHAGDTFGYHSNMCIVPELGVAVVILTNTASVSSARSTMGLVNQYLRATTGKTYTAKLVKREVKNEKADEHYNSMMQGVYFLNGSALRTDDQLRLVGKQGPAKLVFERVHPDSTLYTVTPKLFGFINIKVKDQFFRFEELDGKTYLKGINTSNHSEEYVSMNQPAPIALPDSWKNALGNYELSGDYFTCTNCAELNFSKLKSAVLKEKEGYLWLSIQYAKSKSRDEKYLVPVSNSAAMSTGIGRGTGEAVVLQPDGTLYYSGLVFRKKG